jgi:hypothetical protein
MLIAAIVDIVYGMPQATAAGTIARSAYGQASMQQPIGATTSGACAGWPRIEVRDCGR